MYKALFSLDSIDETRREVTPFEGYTTGDLWNGWSTPCFTKQEADRLVEALNETNEAIGPLAMAETFAWYDEGQDAYITVYENESDAVDKWDVVPTVVDGETIALYAIGAYCWTWNVLESKEN